MEQGRQFEKLRVLSSGIFGLILMLGIARFAYTPLLPLMLDQTAMSLSQGGWLASVNYMGYLSGVLIAAGIRDLRLKDMLYRWGLLVAIVSTFGMAVTESAWLWAAMRYLAGLSSAAGLMLGTGLIMNWLIRHQHRPELGIHFSGIGLGIVFCAGLVGLLSSHLSVEEQWVVFGVLGVLCAWPAWRWLPRLGQGTHTVTGQLLAEHRPSSAFLLVFMLAYLCAGVGYVISATFIVEIIKHQSGAAEHGLLAFGVLGIFAAPACILWDLIARKTGYLNALFLAFCIHTLSMVIPLLAQTLVAAYVSAALYGATFIGIVSLVLTVAGLFYPARPANMMSKMTISYGLAQILAPAVAAVLSTPDAGYRSGLVLAAVFMVIGCVLMAILILQARRDTEILAVLQ